MQHGLYFDANYTYADNEADNQGDAPSGFAGEVNYGGPIANRFNIKQDLGNVEGTRRHRMLLTGVYQLPFGRGRSWMNGGGVKDAFLGGWDLTTVTLLETGPWLTPSISAGGCQTTQNPDGSCPALSERATPDERPIEYERSQSWRSSAPRCRLEKLLCRPVQSAVLQPGRLRTDTRWRRPLWQCGRRYSARPWNCYGQPRRCKVIPHHGEGACPLRIYLHQCAEPYELRSARNGDRQPFYLRSTDRGTDCRERGQSYRTG